MKRIYRTVRLLAALLLLLPATAGAQSAAVKRIMEMAREDNQAMHHLDILCNRFGGRPVGSDAYENAAEWAIRSFRSWGYEVRTEEAGSMSVGFNRAGWWGRMTGEEQMTLHFSTPSYSSGTHGVQRGHVVIEPRTWAEFDRMKGRLKGAWVLVEDKSSGYAIFHGEEAHESRLKAVAENEEIERYNREHPDDPKKLNKVIVPFYDEMVEAGVLGFIQPADVPLWTLYDMKVVQRALEGSIAFEELPAVPSILLDNEQFDRIRTMVKQRRRIELEFDIRNHFKYGPIPFHNVVAEIKGAKHPDEYVIVGAHLDSYDVATGGVDCGSGVAAVMEAARMIALSGAKPDRTILFILFAGEEFGLLGSKAWVKAHSNLLPRISNMFNRDGGPMPYTGFWAPESLLKEYEKAAEPLRQLYPEIGFTVEPLKPRVKPERTGGNDASTFAVEGVPAVQMNEWRDVKGYDFSYREIWHTERDTYNMSIPEYQEQAATAMALMVLATANMPSMLPRHEVYTPATESDSQPGGSGSAAPAAK